VTCSARPLITALEANLARLRRRIASATEAVGRRADEVVLLPVTKAAGVEVAAAFLELGWTDLAENRLQGLERKAAALGDGERPPRWHFIGHLQRNKARRVCRLADVIHSVDTLQLIETLERVAREEARRPEVYLQLALTGEDAKHGLEEEELEEAVDAVRAADSLELLGLMAMGPLWEEGDLTTATVFARAGELARDLEARRGEAFVDGRCRLSMGMSDDLEVAVAAGSTCLRIGSDLLEGLPRPGEGAG